MPYLETGNLSRTEGLEKRLESEGGNTTVVQQI